MKGMAHNLSYGPGIIQWWSAMDAHDDQR